MVSNAAEVIANIEKYTVELCSSANLQARVAFVRSWYAHRAASGDWLFAPSKFVGYLDNSAEKYIRDTRKSPASDGGETESVLTSWFGQVDSASRLGQELHLALNAFLKPYGRANARARINVAKGETGLAPLAPSPAGIDARIVSSPEVCGGRPRIKGTRMPVFDLLELLASGASREEILADFPYISGDDINAAIAFAARAADHRVIRAA